MVTFFSFWLHFPGFGKSKIMYALILKEGNDLERGAGYAMMGMSLDPLWQLLFIEDATNGI